MTWQLLLHCDGVDGGTSFPNSAPSGFTPTVFSCTTRVAYKQFGTASLYPSGSFSCLNILGTESFAWQAQNFVIDLWFRPYQAAIGFLFSAGALYNSTTQNGIMIWTTTTELKARVVANNIAYDIVMPWVTYGITIENWHHFALCRDGAVIRSYIKGVAGPTVTLPSAETLIQQSSDTWYVATNLQSSSTILRMNLDEIAVRTGEFIDFSATGVPTAAYTIVNTLYGDGAGSLQQLTGNAVTRWAGAAGILQELGGLAQTGIPTNDGWGDLKELTGSATTYDFAPHLGYASGSVQPLAGSGVVSGVNYCAGIGKLKELSGRARLTHRAIGPLQRLTGSASVVWGNEVNASGPLGELFGTATAFTRKVGNGAGRLRELIGTATAFKPKCGYASGRLQRLTGYASAAPPLINAASGALRPITGLAMVADDYDFDILQYLWGRVRK